MCSMTIVSAISAVIWSQFALRQSVERGEFQKRLLVTVIHECNCCDHGVTDAQGDQGEEEKLCVRHGGALPLTSPTNGSSMARSRRCPESQVA